jgi:hypothetical protein
MLAVPRDVRKPPSYHWRTSSRRREDIGRNRCVPAIRLPWSGLNDELSWLLQAGLSPMEALQTATIEPGTFLDQEKNGGTAEAGKIADLVLISDNPLTDISNTRKIVAVVRDRRLFDRTALDKFLADVAAFAAQTKVPAGPMARSKFVRAQRNFQSI